MFHFNLSRKRLFKLLGCLAVSMLLISYSVYPFPLQDRGVALPRIQVGGEKEIDLYKESHALVIGASEYINGWGNLPGVKRDVREITEALKIAGFQVETLLDPTRVQFDQGIRRFIRQKAQEPLNRILIYFAGHGHTLATSDGRQLGYIVPVDAPFPSASRKALFKEAAISMDEVEVYARQIESKHALFVFDSCFSGSLFEVSRAIPPAISSKTGLPVRQFITAGTAEQEVSDKSVFCTQFIEGITGGADLNKDGYVTGSELGIFLEDKVTNYTKKAQTPRWGKIRDAHLDKGDFVFSVSKEAERREAGKILIWKVGSPHNGDTPDKTIPLELRQAAKKLGVSIQIEAFPAKGFADLYFIAVADHQEPDILAFDNYGIIEGITTKLGNFTGIGSSRQVKQSLVFVSESLKSLESGRGGWQCLITTSANHKAAKELAIGRLDCGADSVRNLAALPSTLTRPLTKLATDAVTAWHTKNVAALDTLASGKYPIDSLTLPAEARTPKHVQVCDVWGNERLAFVATVASFEAKQSIGHQSLTVVFKQEQATWRLLQIGEKRSVLDKLASRTPTLPGTLSTKPLSPITILGPPDKARFDDRFNNRPILEWTSAGNGDVIYMVESQFEGKGWSGSYFDVLPVQAANKETISVRASFGIGAQPHRWRVWAINGIGESFITNWREVHYTR